jgi:hypothetical protein
MSVRVSKWKCRDCKKVSTGAELLRAPSPFDPEDILAGCPHCKSCEGFSEMCDQPGCDKDASCGWSSPNGYRRTCYNHWTREEG